MKKNILKTPFIVPEDFEQRLKEPGAPPNLLDLFNKALANPPPGLEAMAAEALARRKEKP